MIKNLDKFWSETFMEKCDTLSLYVQKCTFKEYACASTCSDAIQGARR